MKSPLNLNCMLCHKVYYIVLAILHTTNVKLLMLNYLQRELSQVHVFHVPVEVGRIVSIPGT